MDVFVANVKIIQKLQKIEFPIKKKLYSIKNKQYFFSKVVTQKEKKKTISPNFIYLFIICVTSKTLSSEKYYLKNRKKQTKMSE